MELRQYYGIVRKWLWLILLGTILASATSYLLSRNLPRVYQASTTLIVGTVTSTANPEYSSVLAGQMLAKTYSKILTSGPVLQGAVERLGLEDSLSPREVASSVTVETVRDTQLVVLRIRSRDPELASRLANAIADELIFQSPASPQGQLGSVMSFVQKQMGELEKEISGLQGRIKELKDAQAASPRSSMATVTADELVSSESKLRSAQERYGTLLTVRAGMSTNYVSIIERSETPGSPIDPGTSRNALMAGFVGLLLALGTAFLIEYLDDTVKSPEVINQLVSLPTLGIVSRLSRRDAAQGLVTLRAPKSSATEAFRSLRTSIQFSSPDKPLTSLLVTSADPGDGKSTTLSNLAVTMAQAGLKVIAVDADLRRPTLHKLFGLSNSVGLTSLLSGQATEIGSVIQLTDEPNLFVVTSGPLPPNPAELLGSQRLQNVFNRLQQEADFLLFDSPPALVVTDAAILSTKVDGVVLVVDSGHTRLGSLKQAVEHLRQVGGAVAGVVINKFRPSDGRYYSYGYYYYYYYYYSSEGKEKDGKNGRNGHSSLIGRLLNGRRGTDSGRSRRKRSY